MIICEGCHPSENRNQMQSYIIFLNFYALVRVFCVFLLII